jgi:1L-myo-inositol 1-phosphate cytidylyltransferase / CDP-L-myo-inositol myo-inositolphosphotransferase
MALIGLISVARPREDLPGVPRASLMAGGITLLERNVRLLQAAGAAKIYALVDLPSPRIATVLEKLRLSNEVVQVPQALDLASLLEVGDRVVMIEEGVLVDHRLVRAIVDAAETAIAVWPVATPQGGRAVRLDSHHGFGSVFVCRSDVVRTVCKGLGDWDLEQTLLRAVTGDADVVFVDASALTPADTSLQRDVALVWQPMSAHPDEDVAMDLLVDGAQSANLSWPEHFLHPVVENAAVRTLAATAIAPLHVFGVALLVGLAASVAFAYGWMWSGCLLALLVSPLEGVQRKLARVRVAAIQYPRVQFWLMQWIVFMWFAHMALHFSHAHGKVGPWMIVALICVTTAAIELQKWYFRKITGAAFESVGNVERKLQLLGGSRITFFWMLLPFGFFNQWYAGFGFMALSAVATFFAVQWRVFGHLAGGSGDPALGQ